MPDIGKMTSDEWLAHRREKLDDFFAQGGEIKPNPGCRSCDIENDDVCFNHELLQIGE